MAGECICKRTERRQGRDIPFQENASHRSARANPMKYVSRGGYKLEKAIDLWQVPLQDKICMDVGSSTGGFHGLHAAKRSTEVYMP